MMVDTAEIVAKKKAMRTAMARKRDGLNPEVHQQYSSNLCSHLTAAVAALSPEVVHTYLPMGSEPDFWLLISQWLAEGKTIVCPEALKGGTLLHRRLLGINHLEVGRFGTRHPSGPYYDGMFDLVLVPGLAFDNQCRRLGYGGGYYDRFLATKRHSKAWGICFEFQIVPNIPLENHDAAVDKCITDSRG